MVHHRVEVQVAEFEAVSPIASVARKRRGLVIPAQLIFLWLCSPREQPKKCLDLMSP